MEVKDEKVQEVQNEKKINANPTKEFFISMLVRDIALEPAIAELVDNSLDGAKNFRKSYNFSDVCKIDVSFDEDKFCISDTCGGISYEAARDYCFRFGRDNSRPYELANGTGVFGIGMKRALFRMGKVFDIVSITPTEHFFIHVDVDTWLKEEGNDWTFEFTELGRDETNPLEKCGTKITVTDLYDPIKYSFANPYFRDSFHKYIMRRSSMIKDLNVQVIINEKNIIYEDIKILFGKSFAPYVQHLTLDDVNITVIAGCAKMGEPKNAGWYVSCNSRMVLFANQKEETGWGTEDIRAFHPSYASFRGIVLFESANLENLPWNTTKTGVDSSSKYYQRALEIMRDVERSYISWRKEVDEFIAANEEIDAKSIFSDTEYDINSPAIQKHLVENSDFGLPELNSTNFPVPPEPMTSIPFRVEKSKVQNIKEHLNKPKMSNKEVAEVIFNYFYEREIDEDE